MSDESQGPGWWLASDGKWYPPELAPGPQSYTPPTGSSSPVPSTIDATAAFSYGWRKFTANLGPVLLVVLIPVAVQLLINFVFERAIHSFAGVIVFSVIAQVISLMLAIGIYNAALMLTRGEEVDIGRAFHTDNWVSWILFAFVWGLMVAVGAIFCLVGAFIVIAIWGLAPYYFLDRHMGLGEALSASAQTTGSTPGLRVALALTALFGVLGVIACGIGVFVTMPCAYIGGAYLYRLANREPVAP